MNRKKILVPAFILVVLVQLYVPAKMILDQENILRSGTVYKFRTAPIDPYDPFRGKYIELSYRETTFETQEERDWMIGETVYVSFTTDNNGYAKIKSISKNKPVDTDDFLKTKLSFVSRSGINKLTIDYPFDKYYMEESKAYEAERIYQQSRIDTNQVAYALVSIKKGDAVLKDVLIDGTPIKEIVRWNQQK